MKTWLRLTITFVLCAALLLFVVDLGEVMQTLARCDPGWALVAIVALTLDRVLMSYKWGLLLSIRGYDLGLVQKLTVYCSAMMWGLALPSTVGADGIRIMLARGLGVRVDDALATILIERGIGFISALVTALAGVLILRALLPDGVAYDAWLLGGAALLLVTVGIVIVSFSPHALRWVPILVPRRVAEARGMRFFARLHAAYRSLAFDHARLGAFASLTLIEQLLMVACYGFAAAALQIQFNEIYLFAAVPLAILISRLPVSIDGLGVYEGIFIAVMTLGGVRAEDSLAISLAARALQIIVWLPWWLLHVLNAKSLRPPRQLIEG